MAVYTAIDDPEAYFQTVLYTGDGAANHAITLPGDTDMQPDLVWIKNRDATDSNCLFDSTRGATKILHSDTNALEATDADTLDSFTSDGFQVDADVKVNTNTEDYVAWNWKETADAGFDITTATGTGSAKTIAHSLSAVPHLIISKEKSGSVNDWVVYHHKNTSAPETDKLILNEPNATSDDSCWNDTTPTTSVFSVSGASVTNRSSSTYVYYLWSEKQGFSRFGSYKGNGNADGTFVYLGFRPAWVMVKCTTTANSYDHWIIYDNKRLGYNIAGNRKIYADANEVEAADTDLIDLLSNGFKFRNTHSNANGSGETYVYIAFAEAPLVNSEGVPCNAR